MARGNKYTLKNTFKFVFKDQFHPRAVKTSPVELIMSTTGPQVITGNLLHFGKDKVSTYSSVVIVNEFGPLVNVNLGKCCS